MNMADQSASGAFGFEQIRALMRSGRRSGIAETLDFQLVEVAEGRAVFEGTPGTHAYNPIGSVHGGYAAPCSTPPAASRCTASWLQTKPTPRWRSKSPTIVR